MNEDCFTSSAYLSIWAWSQLTCPAVKGYWVQMHFRVQVPVGNKPVWSKPLFNSCLQYPLLFLDNMHVQNTEMQFISLKCTVLEPKWRSHHPRIIDLQQQQQYSATNSENALWLRKWVPSNNFNALFCSSGFSMKMFLQNYFHKSKRSTSISARFNWE